MERDQGAGMSMIDFILLDDAFQSIIESTNYEEVFFKILREYMPKRSNDYRVQRNVACKLFVYYLKKLEQDGKVSKLYEETMEFLLSHELDLNYEGVDMYGTPAVLEDTLALGLNNYPRLMGMYLDLIDGVEYKIYGNGHYELYTDTVRMNVEAGRIDTAIELFESDVYPLFPIEEAEAKSKLKLGGEGLYVDEFLGGNRDSLFALLVGVRGSRISLPLRRAFLNTILYSLKIRFFNVAGLSSIKQVLSEDELARFTDYLFKKALKNEIVLYRFDEKESTIHYQSVYEVFCLEDCKRLELKNN